MQPSNRRHSTRRSFLGKAAAGSGLLMARALGHGPLLEATKNTPQMVPDAQNSSAAQIDFLNVKLPPYNAAGNGQTDDRAALQRALDDAAAAGGAWVYLPAGVYALGGTLLLRDRANLTGAGPFAAQLRWAGAAGQPVLSDQSFGQAGQSAFGRVNLAQFGIEGGGPSGAGYGIATTAYFSTFQNLYISGCASDGMRFGFEGLQNYASQNQISGCRVAECGAAAIHLDIHAVDTSVTECFLHDCQIGVLIQNGGHRIENNDIFGHRDAAVAIQQTVSNVIISGNDLNANRHEAITVTRSSIGANEAWGQVLIIGNAIVEDGLDADNTYDAIRVETNVPNGITGLTIANNKIALGKGPNRFRYGVNLFRNVAGANCSDNHVVEVGESRYFVGQTCTNIEIDSLGPVTLSAPPLARSGQPLQNPFHAPVTIYVSGGAVSSVTIGAASFRFTGGALRLRASESVALDYTGTPSWAWLPD
jgi:hypothetical protein